MLSFDLQLADGPKCPEAEGAFRRIHRDTKYYFNRLPPVDDDSRRLRSIPASSTAARSHEPRFSRVAVDYRRACLTEWVLSGADAHNADRAAVIFGRTMFQLSLLFHNLRFKSLASNMYHAAAVKKINKCESANKKASFLPDGTVTVKWEPVDSDLWRSRLQWAA